MLARCPGLPPRGRAASRARLLALPILAVVAVVFLAACGTGDGGGSSESAPTSAAGASQGDETSQAAEASEDDDPTVRTERLPRPDPNPTSIAITRDEGGSVSETIGASGGVLAAALPGGLTATITIPEGALLSDVEITMIPVAGAEGEVLGDAALAGVVLEPDGLTFLRLVELEVSGLDGGGWIGFGAEGDGSDFHATPVVAGDGSVKVATSHFSGVGIMNEQLAVLLSDHTPSSAQNAWESELADADINQDGFNLIMLIFKDWTDDLGGRLNSQADESESERLTGEVVSLLDRLERRVTAQVEGGGSITLTEAGELVVAADLTLAWTSLVGRAIERHTKACPTDGPVAAFRALRWVSVLRGLSDRSPLVDIPNAVTENLQSSTSECLEFKVTWTAALNHINSTLNETWNGTATSEATVQVPVTAALVDTGTMGGGVSSADLHVTTYSEDRRTSPLFPCTPTFGPGEMQFVLNLEVTLGNLNDLADTEITQYIVNMTDTEPAVIGCRENPAANNRWSTLAQWIGRDNDANRRLPVAGTARYEVPIDAAATPAGSRGTLVANWSSDTTITGDATTTVSQTIVVVHKP